MSEPFIAEIRIFAGDFAPSGWAFCDGQLLPISQNTALFSLIGTTYGGDGKSTTALPNLQDRVPMHPGQGPGLAVIEDIGSLGNHTCAVGGGEVWCWGANDFGQLGTDAAVVGSSNEPLRVMP